MATSAASDRRRQLQDLVRSRDESQGTPARRWLKRALLCLLLLALLLVPGLWLGGYFSPHPQVLAMRTLVDEQIAELRKVERGEATLSYDSPGFGQAMEQMREMPRELRADVSRDMGRLFEARERAEINSYFAMSPAARQAELDRRIKAEDARRKAREAERAKRGDQPSGQARGGDGGRPPQFAGGPNGGQGGPGGRGTAGGPSGRRGGTEESRNNSRKRAIDSSTPEERARRTEYRRAMDERRAKMGLEPRRG